MSSWKKIRYKFADDATSVAQHGRPGRGSVPSAITMRTQPPTPPFNVASVEMARYGDPQHESVSSTVTSLYGPPQHETEITDPDWLISIASMAFSVEAPEPAGTPERDEQPAQHKERERTVVRL